MPEALPPSPLLTLHTARLLLRGFEPQDLPELATMLADPQVMRYSVSGLMCPAACEAFMTRSRQALVADGYAPLAMIEQSSGRLAGFCGLLRERFEHTDEVMLGYRLGPAFWGRGLASEAVRGVLAHGFDTLALDSVVAVVQPENGASVKVLHNAGFNGWLNARYHGMGVRIYRMTGQHWQAQRC